VCYVMGGSLILTWFLLGYGLEFNFNVL